MSLSQWTLPTVIWLLFWLIWPWLNRRLLVWLEGLGQTSAFWYAELEPWFYGLVPPYAAWFLGWVPARLLGFNGRGGLVGWLLFGIILLVLLLFYWRWLLPKLQLNKLGFRPDHALLDEPRWAFYRGIAWLWLWDVWWGMLLGLLFILVEWTLTHRTWLAEQRTDEIVYFDLARRATSTLAFALSGNLWLTMIFQVGLMWPLIPENQGEEDSS